MAAWDRRRYLFVPRPCRKSGPPRALYGFVPQVSVNGRKGTKNISYLQIKSQIFSNLYDIAHSIAMWTTGYNYEYYLQLNRTLR